MLARYRRSGQRSKRAALVALELLARPFVRSVGVITAVVSLYERHVKNIDDSTRPAAIRLACGLGITVLFLAWAGYVAFRLWHGV